jgi:hypothetical protein
MALSMQEYVIRLRTIYQQVEVLTGEDGGLPPFSELEWAELFARVFQAVPELEQRWSEISVWVNTLTILLESYQKLAGEWLEEEDTAKLPASPAQQERRGLLSSLASGEVLSTY